MPITQSTYLPYIENCLQYNVEIGIIYLAPGESFPYPFETHYSPSCYMLCRDARDKIIFCCTGSESDVPHYCRKPMLQDG